MTVSWIDNLTSIEGVNGALIVDADGLIIHEGGDASAELAPHSALMVKNLIDKIGIKTLDGWQWTQCRTGDLVLAVCNVYVGILVLVMSPDIDLGKVRKEAMSVRNTLLGKFRPPYTSESGG